MVSCTERASHRGDLMLEFMPVVWEAGTLHPVGPAVLLANFWAVLNSALTAQLLGWNSISCALSSDNFSLAFNAPGQEKWAKRN